MKRRKRAPGAGRPPQGPFRRNTAQLTVRMPEDLRARLALAARSRGRGLSQELMARLNSSFQRDREQARDPALRALCFLISEVASQLSGWAEHAWLSQAFQGAVARVLAEFDPSDGKQKPSLEPVLKAYRANLKKVAATANKGRPLRMVPGFSHKKWVDGQVDDLAKRWTTPEVAGNEAATSALAYFHRGLSPGAMEAWQALKAEEATDGLPEGDWVAQGAIAASERIHYGMADARRDLGLASRPSKRRVKDPP